MDFRILHSDLILEVCIQSEKLCLCQWIDMTFLCCWTNDLIIISQENFQYKKKKKPFYHYIIYDNFGHT